MPSLLSGRSVKTLSFAKIIGELRVRYTRLLIDAISVICITSARGCTTAPPRDLLKPVDPVGVATQSPSPRKFSNNSPLIYTSHKSVPFTLRKVASFKAA